MILPPLDTQYLLDFLTGLLKTPSPTGYAHRAVAFTRDALAPFDDLKAHLTPKGTLIVTWPGKASNAPRALTAHVDTLGAMVKDVKPDGRLKLTRLGGYFWNTVEGETCTVFLRDGQTVRGTILLYKASSHVYSKDVGETERNDETMEVRLDARTESAEETFGLGIDIGDFVAFDPRVEVVNGFVRSRHLDDKSSVACIVAAVKALHDAGLRPAQTTYLHFSNYEEMGHGGSAGFPPDIVELLAVDMAAIGDGQASDEFHATICVKDSSGPYDHNLGMRLRQLADDHQIPYKVDIYPYYGSDGSAYWRSGGSAAVALIGPGVDASHNYERTHLDALTSTTQWVMAYLLSS